MTRKETALALFREGFSCSQAVLAAFSERYGLDRETALKLAQPLGGGIARRADWCGAVTGALLVIGLKLGRTRAEDAASRDRTYAVSAEFIRRFEARFGALKCRDLLGCDIGTPAGAAEASTRRLHETLCADYVSAAADLLEDLLGT
jgi:C_GCAxxG_C_C family probable redox protein